MPPRAHGMPQGPCDVGVLGACARPHLRIRARGTGGPRETGRGAAQGGPPGQGPGTAQDDGL